MVDGYPDPHVMLIDVNTLEQAIDVPVSGYRRGPARGHAAEFWVHHEHIGGRDDGRVPRIDAGLVFADYLTMRIGLAVVPAAHIRVAANLALSGQDAWTGAS